MFRPPFLARVAAGAAVYAIEETRRLPTAAAHFPITAISQLLQTTMHAQQFVTSLALKGDVVFDRFVNRPVEQPEWATFDEDAEDERAEPGPGVGAAPAGFRTASEGFGAAEPVRVSSFDLYPEPALDTDEQSVPDAAERPVPDAAEAEAVPAPESETTEPEAPEPARTTDATTASTNSSAPVEVIEPEVATRYDYGSMTLAQLRARLRMFSVEDLTALLDYEQQTRDRAPFVTMLTNRIATVRAK
ncbi:lipid droplet-associated protein [Nocardia sp. BMG51109]|uniref:lipid droplet-associated protein n=1 Tax=Nocardia sp. BMG51109 TaxID=1056816 RepID=UPI0004669EB9|nr:lipid droplet-associated protein [Nocardia sp. BMG51109]